MLLDVPIGIWPPPRIAKGTLSLARFLTAADISSTQEGANMHAGPSHEAEDQKSTAS